MISIYTDGLAEPNPGIGTYGYVIYHNSRKIASRGDFVGESVTNNHAEYAGLAAALSAISRHADEPVVVKSDSKMLVNQMAGKWKVSKKAAKSGEGSYYEMYLKAKEAATGFSKLRFEWIPREENTEADTLSRVAYAEHLARRKR